MSNGIFSRLSKRSSLAKPDTRTKRAVLFIFFAAFFALGVGYHLILWNTSQPPTFVLELLYNLLILAGYGTLWGLLSVQFKERRSTPAKAFWHTLVLGVLLSGLAFVITRIPGGFSPDGLPLTLTTVVTH